MKLRLLPGIFIIRRLVRELSGIREQLTRQTDLLARLADHVAPQLPTVDRETVAAETGLSFMDPVDMSLALSFSERLERDTGHPPTDEELVAYLADEKTVDLHARLIARDRELERAAQERRR